MAEKIMHGMVIETYTPTCQRFKDNPAVFELKPLDGLETMEVYNELSRNVEGDYKISGTGLRIALKYGLVGWSNLLDKEKNEVAFSLANMGKIIPMALSELADKIVDISDLGIDEKKTS